VGTLPIGRLTPPETARLIFLFRSPDADQDAFTAMVYHGATAEL
jgi:hypothetical protein